jgi:DeoR family fructose operon transcriptional repressor
MVDASTRRDIIRESVEREGYVSLSSLSEELGVAPVTIHRDLDLLESAGVIERVRGGARSVVGGSHSIPTEFAARQTQMSAQKSAIALRAMDEIPDGATVFMDSSTTVAALAPYLAREPGRGLTVVTNSPALIFHLVAPLTHVVTLPGELNQTLRAVTGRWTVEFIEQLSFNVAFISAAGITRESGLMTTQRELSEVAKAAISRSERTIALVDSSKFGVSAMLQMAPKEALDLVITDTELSDAQLAEYRAAGINLVKA